MPGRKTISTDERGASVAVNHVLALGITAILISGLLLSAATLLRDQRANNAEPELRTIGNRIAAQIAEGERVIDTSDDDDSVTFHLDQPNRIGGTTYEVQLDSAQCSGPYQQPASSSKTKYCVVVESNTVGEVEVPLNVDLDNDQIQITPSGPGEYEIKVCGGSSGC